MVRAADLNSDGFADIVLPGDGKDIVYYYGSPALPAEKFSIRELLCMKTHTCMPVDAQIVDTEG